MSTLYGAFRKVKMTPEEPTPLQGYDPNAYIADPAADVLDDLYARVFVLDDGARRNVLVSVDCCLTNETTFQAADPGGKPLIYRHLLMTFPEGTRRQWAAEAGIDELDVSVHATHTHSAPEHFAAKYTDRIAGAIREAAADLKPLRMRIAAGDTAVSSNRRPRLSHNEALPIDKTLTVAVFEDEAGRPVGGIVNCAVHPTLLVNPFHRISAEFVGLAVKRWEEAVGGGFAALFVQGFSGDVGPYGHHRSEPGDSYPWVQRLGGQFYAEIDRLAARAEPAAAIPLVCASSSVRLPTKAGYFKPEIAVSLHALRIGELLLFSVPAEVFNGYTGFVRSFSPLPYTMCAGISNGYCGYLPTAQAFNDGLGGYEMNTTPYREEASGLFAEAAKRLLGQFDRT
ncbi:MAG: hypothetical protein J7639_06035 [Paenibacillaceae bacterium]|nr:hypothetical protein [Paenibacillaceae bacterium]